MQRQLSIDVWSDIACPWCYIGKRHLEQALEKFAHPVAITWHSFELDPRAPAAELHDEQTMAQRLAKKYRVDAAQAGAMIQRVVDAGARAGLEMKFDRVKSGNTFDGHRLIHWALAQGKQVEMKERLMRAYFVDGIAMSDRPALARLAGEIGLDADAAAAMLATDQFADDVRGDEATAQELGISGVPFFVLGKKIGVSGAQPADTMGKMLAKAWAELPAENLEGEACAADGSGAC